MTWGEKRIPGASQGRSAMARGGVAGDFSRNRPVTVHSFPRAIVHGDSFFAAGEVAKNPRLRGKPVITYISSSRLSTSSASAYVLLRHLNTDAYMKE